MYKNLLNFSARVDFQATLIAICISLCSAFLISQYYHTRTHDLIVNTYITRSDKMYEIVSKTLPDDSFTILRTPEDMKKSVYIKEKAELERLRDEFSVLYLYTAGINEDGELIYLIDGLSEDDDFRYPGDLIEEEIIPDMQHALDGIIIYPEQVKETSWGNIFVTYFPYHDKETNEVLGVIGIEFAADDLFSEYSALKKISMIIAGIACVLAFALSSFIFRRMSNPNIKDTTYIDKDTLLKNRSAFNLEMHKLEQREYFDGKGVILVDIDKLKNVNRVIGPYEGDVYIKLVADVIVSNASNDMMAYRLKGGEFAVITSSVKAKELKEFCERITNEVAEHEHLPVLETGITCGYAVFEKNEDLDLRDTISRADRMLYVAKRQKSTSSIMA